MYRERGVLRAPHLAVLVALAQPIRAGCVPELRRLREQLRRVLVVDEEHVVDPPLVEERELVQRVRELGRGVLGRALQVLDALLRALRQPQLAVELRDAQPVQRARVPCRRRLLVELDGLGRLPPAPPPVLAARSCTVGRIGVAVLGGEDEEGEGAVEVLAALVRADAVRVAVREEVLGGHVPAVGEALEEGHGLVDEVVALRDGLLDVHDVPRGLHGDRHRLGGVDHEDRELELQVRVLRLLRVRAVQLERALVRQQRRLVAWAQVGVVEDRACGWGGCADGLSGNGPGGVRLVVR